MAVPVENVINDTARFANGANNIGRNGRSGSNNSGGSAWLEGAGKRTKNWLQLTFPERLGIIHKYVRLCRNPHTDACTEEHRSEIIYVRTA